MALIKFNEDLLREIPAFEPFLLSQFDGKHIDVTTVEDSLNGHRAYLVSGNGVPKDGDLIIAFAEADTAVVPEGATEFKELFEGKWKGWWEWYK